MKMKIPAKPGCFPAQMVLMAITIQFLSLTGRGAEGDTWVRKADMPTPRQVNTIAVNGKIYAIGGATGGGGGPASSAVEEYDPVADSWASKTPMPAARYLFATGAVNGKVYAIGGDPSFLSSPMNAVDEYDPVSDTWTPKAEMPTARSGCAAGVVGGKIYVIGGLTTSGAPALPTVEVYDPATDSWEQKADMPTPRGMLCASVVDGRIFAIGSSMPPSGPWLSTVEMYDPLTDVWTRKANMPTARGNLASSTASGKIYAMGGRSGGTLFATMEEYDPATDVWTRRADMWSTDPLVPVGRVGLGASEVNGVIYAIGGIGSISAPQGLSLVLAYTPPGVGISKPTLSGGTVGRNSVTFEITDGDDTTLDGPAVVVKIDGATAPTVRSKVGKVSSFTHTPSTPYAFGSVHPYEITGKDNFGNSLLFTGQFTQPTPWFPDANLPSPAVVDGMWASRYIFGAGTIDSIPSTLAAIQAASQPDFTGMFADATSPVINHGIGGLFADPLPYADEATALGCCGDDFIMLSVAHLQVLEEGDYTFGMHSDDGFGLRIRGGTALSASGNGQLDPADPEAVVYPALTADSSTRAVYHLKAGVFRIEFFWWERGFGDFGEIYVAKGVFSNDVDTPTWKLVGEATPAQSFVQLGVDATGWSVVSSDPGGTALNTWADAQADLDASAGPATNYDVMNVGDPDTNGGVLPFPKNAPGDQDDYAIKATGKLVVPAAGTYIIGFNSDDGAYVRIAGQTFTRITVNGTGLSAIADPPEQVICDCLSGDSNTRIEITLAAGTYDIEAGMFERAGGSFLTLRGAQSTAPFLPMLAKDGAGTVTAPAGGLGLTDDPVGPVSPSSIGTINAVAVVGVNLLVTFKPADATKTYRLGKTTDFKTWNTLPDAPIPVGGNLVFTVVAEANTFYRVIQQ